MGKLSPREGKSLSLVPTLTPPNTHTHARHLGDRTRVSRLPGPFLIAAHPHPHSTDSESFCFSFPPRFPWYGPDPLHVTLTPKNLKTGIGSTVILSCALLGSPEFTIRWYRNTQLVLPSEAISIRGLSNETLLITSAQKSHSGAYQCFATRKTQTAQDFAIIVLEGKWGAGGSWAGSGFPQPGQEVPRPPDRKQSSGTPYTPRRCTASFHPPKALLGGFWCCFFFF